MTKAVTKVSYFNSVGPWINQVAFEVDFQQADDVIVRERNDTTESLRWMTWDAKHKDFVPTKAARQLLSWKSEYDRHHIARAHLLGHLQQHDGSSHIVLISPESFKRPTITVKRAWSKQEKEDEKVITSWLVKECSKCNAAGSYMCDPMRGYVYQGHIYVWNQHLGLLQYTPSGTLVRQMDLEDTIFHEGIIEFYKDEIAWFAYPRDDTRDVYCTVMSLKDGKRKRRFSLGQRCTERLLPQCFISGDLLYRRIRDHMHCYRWSCGTFLGILPLVFQGFAKHKMIEFFPTSSERVWIAYDGAIQLWQFGAQKQKQQKKRMRNVIN